MLYLKCQNLTEVFKVTEILKYLMEQTQDFEHAERIRRLANSKIVTITKGSNY